MSEERRLSSDRRLSQERRASGDRRLSQERRASGDRRLSQERRASGDRRLSQERRLSITTKDGRRDSVSVNEVDKILNPKEHFKREVLIVVNMIFMTFGILIFSFVYWSSSIEIMALTAEIFEKYIMALGVGIVILSLIGFYGAYHRKRCYLLIFALIMLTVMIAELIFTFLYIQQREKANELITLGWENINPGKRDYFEMTFKCCGLTNISQEENRTEAPCLLNTYWNVTCLNKLVEKLNDTIGIAGGVAVLIGIIEMICFWFAVTVLFTKHQRMTEKETDELVILRRSVVEKNNEVSVIEEIDWGTLYDLGDEVSKDMKDLLIYQLSSNRNVWRNNVDGDYFIYVKDRHPVLCIWMHHQLHPFAHWKRIVLLLSTFFLSFFLSNVYIPYILDYGEDFDSWKANPVLSQVFRVMFSVMVLVFWSTIMRFFGNCSCARTKKKLGCCGKFLRFIAICLGNIWIVFLLLVSFGFLISSYVKLTITPTIRYEQNPDGTIETITMTFYDMWVEFFTNLFTAWALWFVFPGWVMFYFKWTRERKKIIAQRKELGLGRTTKKKETPPSYPDNFDDMKIEVIHPGEVRGIAGELQGEGIGAAGIAAVAVAGAAVASSV